MRRGYAEHWDDTRPKQWEGARFHHTTHDAARFRNYELFLEF